MIQKISFKKAIVKRKTLKKSIALYSEKLLVCLFPNIPLRWESTLVEA